MVGQLSRQAVHRGEAPQQERRDHQGDGQPGNQDSRPLAIRIGTTAIGAAAVLASQGQLIITAVLIVAAIGNDQQLYVSHNTTHSHVRSIYRKLGVSSQAHALQRTRELRLL